MMILKFKHIMQLQIAKRSETYSSNFKLMLVCYNLMLVCLCYAYNLIIYAIRSKSQALSSADRDQISRGANLSLGIALKKEFTPR